MQGIFQKENTDKALKYGIYRHLPTYEKIIRNLVSFSNKNFDIVKKMCENSEMTDEEIQKKIAIAKEKHDHIMLALLTAAQVFNEKYPDCTKMPPSDEGGGTAQP